MVCMYVRTYVQVYVCIYACMYVHMYICMHVCMHICVYANDQITYNVRLTYVYGTPVGICMHVKS